MLLVIYIPPPLRAEAHRIKPMLIVAANRVVVAVAMGNAIVMVIAKVPPLSTGIRWARLPQGECKNDNWGDYCSHRALDELVLRLYPAVDPLARHVPLSTPPQGQTVNVPR
jgi:hypothetical protein